MAAVSAFAMLPGLGSGAAKGAKAGIKGAKPAVKTTKGSKLLKKGIEVGTLFKSSGMIYKVTGKNTVSLQSIEKKKKKVTVPKTVKKDGMSYRVTKIAANACNGDKKITSVSIGENVTSIEANAFYGYKNLKNITYKGTNVKKIGARAFQKTAKKEIYAIPKKVFTKYKKLLKKKVAAKAKYKRIG